MDFLDQDQNKPESETSQRETLLPDVIRYSEILTVATHYREPHLESGVKEAIYLSLVYERKLHSDYTVVSDKVFN